MLKTASHINIKPIKPFKTIRMSYVYVFGQCISVVRVEEFRKTVEILIRLHVLWHLIWVCIICKCPTKRTLDLHVLSRLANIHSQTSYIIAELEPSSIPLFCTCEHKLLWFDYEYVLDNDEMRI